MMAKIKLFNISVVSKNSHQDVKLQVNRSIHSVPLGRIVYLDSRIVKVFCLLPLNQLLQRLPLQHPVQRLQHMVDGSAEEASCM